MEQHRKQSSSKRSEMMSTADSIQSQSASSQGGISSSFNGSQVSSHNTICIEKSQGIRGFLKLLPFMPRFRHKLFSSKQNNERKQTSLSRIRISPTSSLEECDIRKLIRLYQSYDNLYNPSDPDYGNRKIEEICYAKMTSCFPNKTSLDLQNLLYELRLLFEREYTIVENAQRRFGEILLPTIKYYNEFLFLVPYLRINWNSGSCIPPRIPLIEESFSANSCTSDGTNRSMTNSLYLTDELNMETRQESSMEQLDEQSKQAENSQPIPTGVPYHRPAAGKGIFNPCGCGNQFKCFYRKKKAKEKEETLEEESVAAASLKEPSSEHESPATQPSTPTVRTEASSQADVMDVPPAKRLSRQMKEVTSSAATPPQEQLTEGPPTEDKAEDDAPSPQETLSNTPCQGNGDREPCQAYCNQDREHRPTTSQNSPAAAIPSENTKRLSQSVGNQEQLQMLCEMIKMELSSSPDFIYYDAKWRIIEILREVQKRNLIHNKSNPQNRATASLKPKNCNCPLNAICRNREVATNGGMPRNRIHYPMKATQCPYCCKR